jgi:hypothetical protein
MSFSSPAPDETYEHSFRCAKGHLMAVTGFTEEQAMSELTCGSEECGMPLIPSYYTLAITG